MYALFPCNDSLAFHGNQRGFACINTPETSSVSGSLVWTMVPTINYKELLEEKSLFK